MTRPARRKWLTIPTRIVLGYIVVLVAFGVVGGLSFLQHHRTSQTLGLLEDGYLPLALTLSQAKATQSVYANLVERALQSERSTPTKSWLRAALRIRPRTLQRAYDGVDRAEALTEERRAAGAASFGAPGARCDREGLQRDRRPVRAALQHDRLRTKRWSRNC